VVGNRPETVEWWVDGGIADPGWAGENRLAVVGARARGNNNNNNNNNNYRFLGGQPLLWVAARLRRPTWVGGFWGGKAAPAHALKKPIQARPLAGPMSPGEALEGEPDGWVKWVWRTARAQVW